MIYFLIPLLLSVPTWAMNLAQFPCTDKITTLVKDWKATGEWQEEKEGGLRKAFYSSPTDKIGEWVLIRRIPKGTVIAKANEEGRLEVVLDEAKCVAKTKTYTHPERAGFTDKNIAAFIRKNKTGVIYVWSPRMDLSVKGIQEIQKAAREKKLPVLVLMDKDVPAHEKVKLEKKLGSSVTTTVDSFELNMRHVQMHFPAVLVFKNQKIQPGVKYGYEKAHRYKLDLTQLLQ